MCAFALAAIGLAALDVYGAERDEEVAAAVRIASPAVKFLSRLAVAGVAVLCRGRRMRQRLAAVGRRAVRVNCGPTDRLGGDESTAAVERPEPAALGANPGPIRVERTGWPIGSSVASVTVIAADNRFEP